MDKILPKPIFEENVDKLNKILADIGIKFATDYVTQKKQTTFGY